MSSFSKIMTQINKADCAHSVLYQEQMTKTPPSFSVVNSDKGHYGCNFLIVY